MAGERDVALLGQDETGVADRAAGAAAGKHRRDLVAAGAGVLVGAGTVALTKDEGIARGELRLSHRGGDRAGIVDFGPHQQHKTAARGRRDRRAGGDQRAALDHDLAAGAGEARQIAAAALGGVDAVGEELAVGDARGGRDQRADIDLAGAAEDDAVLVDHQHLAGSLDVAQDLARAEIADHAVQRGPVAGLLVEIDRGLRADVECLPVQDRLGRSLVDRHIGLAAAGRLGRQIGALPQRRTCCRSRRHLEPARSQAVRHHDLRQRPGGSSRLRRVAGRGLHRLQGLDRLSCARQCGLALLCDGSRLLRRHRRRIAGKIGSGKCCRASKRPRLRAIWRSKKQRQHTRAGQQRLARQPALRTHGRRLPLHLRGTATGGLANGHGNSWRKAKR